ncbi:MAG: hypothetical protein ACI4QZ_05890 [Eubacteriales bacterium]
MKKRIIAVLLYVITMLSLLTACGGNKTECDFCGETKKCTTKSVFGEKVSVCSNCMKELSDY